VRAQLVAVAICLETAIGCAVYDDSFVSQKQDAAPGVSTTGAAGSGGSTTTTTGGGGAGVAGTDVIGDASTATGGSLGVGGDNASGGSGGARDAGAGMGDGGSSGSGGAGGAKLEAGTVLLIDSMEHGGDGISGAGFSGHWYLFNDQTDGGVETPYPFMMTSLDVANASLPTSTSAAHAAGSGFTGFGCGMGFSITAAAGGKYNASAYTGITFWAKVGAGAATHITVSTFDTRAEVGCTKCGDEPLSSFDATNTWAKYNLPFSNFRQAGFGDPQFGLFDPNGFGGAQFYVGGANKFDLWIDDIAFYVE
jgi:hypothetical protein